MKITYKDSKRMPVSQIPLGTVFSFSGGVFMKVGHPLPDAIPAFVRLSTGYFVTDSFFIGPVEIMEAELLVQPI